MQNTPEHAAGAGPCKRRRGQRIRFADGKAVSTAAVVPHAEKPVTDSLLSNTVEPTILH